MFQLGAALLDACVLAVMARSDTYGYALTQSIKEVIVISESTLYPVLRRLQRDQMLTAYDLPFNGRNRRFYQLTDKGRQRLYELTTEWQEYKTNIDKILGFDIEHSTMPTGGQS
jgi:PadR family transcriptional regulator PadR